MSEGLGTLAALARAMDAQLLGGAGEGIVGGISTDSQTLEPGALFFALRGPRFDGHDFVRDALARGAVGAVVERVPAGVEDGAALLRVVDTRHALGRLAAVHRHRFALPVVGVTGSVGKTSTKELLATLLAARGPVLKTPANLNNEIGVPLTLLQLRAHHRAVVLELAMRGANQIAELSEIAAPTVGVITNVGPAHFEFFDSEEAIARAKGELLERVGARGVAVLNADDPWFPVLRGIARGSVVRFAIDATAEVRAEDVVLEPTRSKWRLVTEQGAVPIVLPLSGRHHIANALAAAAAAQAVGVSLEDIAGALGTARAVTGRLSVLAAARGFTILDDTYNASPASVRAAMEVLGAFPGRRFAVLGEMKELGTRTEELHRATGQVVGRYPLERLITVGEHAERLGRAAASRLGAERWTHVTDAAAARAALLPSLRSGDLVLVKGSRALALDQVVEALRDA